MTARRQQSAPTAKRRRMPVWQSASGAIRCVQDMRVDALSAMMAARRQDARALRCAERRHGTRERDYYATATKEAISAAERDGLNQLRARACCVLIEARERVVEMRICRCRRHGPVPARHALFEMPPLCCSMPMPRRCQRRCQY